MSVPLGLVLDDLDRACNMFGPLRPEVRARVFAALDDPTPETWADARSIVVSWSPETGAALTLWQAVVQFSDLGTRSAHAVPSVEQIAAGLAGAVR